MDGSTMRNRWAGRAPLFHRDPLLIAAALWTLLATGLFFVLDGNSNAQVQTYWAFQPALDLLLAYSAWQVCRIATGPIRRFWWLLAFAGALFIVGDSVQTVTALTGENQWSTTAGPAQSICFALGSGVIIVAMLIHPHPGRNGRERLAFGLDSATVLVGGAVVAWCVVVRPGREATTDVASTLLAAAFVLTVAFATIKIILNGNAPIHKLAALPMIISAGVNSIAIFAAPGADGRLPAWVYAIRFLPSLTVAAGPRIQQLVARFDHNAFGSRRRKAYSLLPYGSIAVAFAALVVVLPQRDGADARLWGVVAGLGLICALVVARQLAAFHDNTRLISQLDTTLAELREQRLRHQALFDGLTGLANRTHFHEEVLATLAGTDPGTVSLLLIDLDGFKVVNDTLGHAAGDALLIGVAGKLRESVRGCDLVARLGGDEFAVLLRDCGTGDSEHTSRGILSALTEPIVVGTGEIRANASIGVACAEPGDDVESLLRDADLAMYAAKHDGKGTWMRYDTSMEPAGR